MFLRGLWRSLGGLRLGSRERHRLGTSLNHVRRLAGARREHLAQRIESRVQLLIGQRLDAAGVLELISLGTSNAQIFMYASA